jgi:hypothetical protein
MSESKNPNESIKCKDFLERFYNSIKPGKLVCEKTDLSNNLYCVDYEINNICYYDIKKDNNSEIWEKIGSSDKSEIIINKKILSKTYKITVYKE